MDKLPQAEHCSPPLDASPLVSLLAKQPDSRSKTTGSKASKGGLQPKPVEGIVVGHLVGLTEEGGILVQFPGNPDDQPVRALAATQIEDSRLGSPVAIAFVGGDIQQPIILGFIRTGATDDESNDDRIVEVQQDGKRLVISAENELVLKCGESTITLTKAGKVLIRGKYLLSRSSGPNRIKGGSVQIN